MAGRDSDEDSLVGGSKRKGSGGVSEAQMERLLLQNLTSSEGEEEEEDGPAKKKSRY